MKKMNFLTVLLTALLVSGSAMAERDYLTFTCIKDGEIVGRTSAVVGQDTLIKPVIEYSLNDGEWTAWNMSAIEMKAGDVVKMKGNNPHGFGGSTKYLGSKRVINSLAFEIKTGQIAASGNIMSLIDGEKDGTKVIPSEVFDVDVTVGSFPMTLTVKPYAFLNMFNNCDSLVSAPELPATTLADSCYVFMFDRCASLTEAPALPATVLAPNCYKEMFRYCSSLVTAPTIAATTLAEKCCMKMFQYCTGLVDAPALLAETMVESCYQTMFDGCSSLKIAPALPATELAYACYSGMFQYCTSLTQAPVLSAMDLEPWCYSQMFVGDTSLVVAPELPATKLIDKCYWFMFGDCKNLNYVKCLATEGINCALGEDNSTTTGAWLDDVAASGTFIKSDDAKWGTSASDKGDTWPIGKSGNPWGIPTNIKQVSAANSGVQKVMMDGQLFITNGEDKFSVVGQAVK